MLDLIVNKLLRPFGYKLEKFGGINAKGLFGDKKFNVGNYIITSPSSHSLSKNLNQYKFYSRNLPRLIEEISKYYNDLKIIDVGANIGDSAALINSINIKPNKIYCFEGDDEFTKYFYRNTERMDNIVLFKSFLGDSDSCENFNVVKDNGTLRINSDNKGSNITIDTLDNISEANKELYDIKFLKTDTDGYDFKILRGAKKLIEKAKPILFFEYDREFLNLNSDDGFSTFEMLKEIGYKNAIIYDNYGRLLVSFDINNELLLKQLDLYIHDKKGAFPYYDICLFNEVDNSIFEKVIQSEMKFYKEQLS